MPTPLRQVRGRNFEESLCGGDTKRGSQRKTQVKGDLEMPVSCSSKIASLLSSLFVLGVIFFTAPSATIAQTELAGVYGRVTDQSGAVVMDAEVEIKNVETALSTTVRTNQDGLYTIPSLHPGHYLINVRKTGFRSVTVTELTLNVQDNVVRNFALQIGSVSETVTITADQLNINTTDATVSTVVDRQFANNLPLNGRSFQTLIDLSPGVVMAAAIPQGYDAGQFNINGQRANANYWTVDGVSANIGTSAAFGGDGVGGALGSFSAQGGTNSLVSVDALQEFRIQTSTYAPEFGRTPGGQISIVTRSGTNQFHGTLFDYLRNDVLDANNWFNTSVTPALPKAKERQNDFGGTFAGPIIKDKTFFFFSYEGLRLRLPQTALTTVPDVTARNSAVAAMQPYLNAYSLPNGTDNTTTGVAQFNASFSNPSSLDAYSLRLDHRLSDKISLLGRYDYSPSENQQRGLSGGALSDVMVSRVKTQTATAGATFAVSSRLTNDLRFNYSRVNSSGHSLLDTFGGAVPLPSLNLPSPFSSVNARVVVLNFALSGSGLYIDGAGANNTQQQWNVVDSVSLQKGPHSVKFGVDFRRLTPQFDPFQYTQEALFFSIPSAEAGSAFLIRQAEAPARLSFRNLGAFAQDTWRIGPRVSLTYGLRWDVDFSPSNLSGPSFPAVTGFNLKDLSQLTVAPGGTPAFHTPYGNVAPRVGVAYQVSQSQNWGTVARGGFGVFYDLATQQTGNLINQFAYPFAAMTPASPGSFPAPTLQPPPISPPGSGSGTVLAFDPNLQLPYTLEWNVAVEQGLGQQQTLSASYVGSAGRRLIQSAFIAKPNPNYATAVLVANTATSDYESLQIQFQRRLSHGLQTQASYTWAHSIDDASSGSVYSGSTLVPGLGAKANRGPSDFDIRHTLSGAFTYDLPVPKLNSLTNALLRGWSLQTILLARSAPPVNVFLGTQTALLNSNTQVRPDVVAGVPFYLYGPQYPGGKALNNTVVKGACPGGANQIGPFCPPAANRQGNLGRNFLRGFGATQWDFATHRDFPIREALKLQFRAEMFNILNHPNFGQPVPNINATNFGQANQLLNQYLSGGLSGSGSLSPLYQVGGPRSIQFALKFIF